MALIQKKIKLVMKKDGAIKRYLVFSCGENVLIPSIDEENTEFFYHINSCITCMFNYYDIETITKLIQKEFLTDKIHEKKTNEKKRWANHVFKNDIFYTTPPNKRRTRNKIIYDINKMYNKTAF